MLREIDPNSGEHTTEHTRIGEFRLDGLDQALAAAREGDVMYNKRLRAFYNMQQLLTIARWTCGARRSTRRKC